MPASFDSSASRPLVTCSFNLQDGHNGSKPLTMQFSCKAKRLKYPNHESEFENFMFKETDIRQAVSEAFSLRLLC